MFFSFLLCCFIFIFHGVTWYSVCLLHYKVHNSGCKVSTNFLNDKFLASFIAEHLVSDYLATRSIRIEYLIANALR